MLIKFKQNGGSGAGSAKVNDFVNGEWNGTAVPSEGYVENIYINKDLSIEQVVNIMDTFFNNHPEFNNLACIVKNDDDNYKYVEMSKQQADENTYGYLITYNGNDILFINIEAPFCDFVGWKPGFEGIINFNSVTLPVYGDTDTPINTCYSELAELFSITAPTQKKVVVAELSGEYDGSAVEFVPESAPGTPVPGDGSLVDIYVNTTLSVEEVTNILNTIEYDTYGEYYAFMYDAGSGTYGLKICKYDSDKFEIVCSFCNYGIYDIWRSYETTYDNRASGWNIFSKPYIDKYPLQPSYCDQVIVLTNNQNDKLVNLFSITPFTGSVSEIDLKPYIEAGKLPLKIKLK